MPDLVVNELLCYCRNNYERATIKQLKMVLCSFYSEEELGAGKNMLHEAASVVSSNFPRLIKRSKSDNRCKLLADDLIEFLTKIDEDGIWDSLPVYVAQNLARIPTVAIEDIEVFIMAQKLDQLETRLKKVEVGHLLVDKSSGKGVGSKSRDAVNITSTGTPVEERASGSGAGSGVDDKLEDADVGLMEEECDGKTGWVDVVKKGSKKISNFKPKVVGCNKSYSTNLKAAKPLQRKFIFHLDNVVTDLPCSEIMSFMSDNGVEAINCFSAKSWIHSKEDQLNSCFAYRVRVKLEDKSKILDGAYWPEGVLVREWKFKSKN